MSDLDLPKRKTFHLAGYDYSQNGAYFITICTQGRTPLFGNIVGAAAFSRPTIALSQYGQIADRYINNINVKYQNISVPIYCIMPNHVHIILTINTYENGSPRAATPTVSIPRIVNSLKSLATKEAGMPLWQRGYYEHIIRGEQDYQNIWQYIENNAAKWVEDQYYLQ